MGKISFTLIRIIYGHEKLQFGISFDYLYWNNAVEIFCLHVELYLPYSIVFMNILFISWQRYYRKRGKRKKKWGCIFKSYNGCIFHSIKSLTKINLPICTLDVPISLQRHNNNNIRDQNHAPCQILCDIVSKHVLI